MTVRLLTDPLHSAELRGDGIVLKFRALGSKLGPVEVELDTGEAMCLMDEIEAAIGEADDAALAARGDPA